MDSAAFIASLAPDLRQEVLLTADDEFLRSLPPAVAQEAQRLREERGGFRPHSPPHPLPQTQSLLASMLRQGSEAHRQRADQSREQECKLRLEKRRHDDDPPFLLSRLDGSAEDQLISSLRLLVRMLYMRQPVDMGLLQTLLRNLAAHKGTALKLISCLYAALKGREALVTPRPQLLTSAAVAAQKFSIDSATSAGHVALDTGDDFPPLQMIGCTSGGSAFDLPQAASASEQGAARVPPAVATRILDLMTQLARSSPFFVYIMLGGGQGSGGGGGLAAAEDVMVVKMIRLMGDHTFRSSRTHLAQLVQVIDCVTAPLAKLRRTTKAPRAVGAATAPGMAAGAGTTAAAAVDATGSGASSSAAAAAADGESSSTAAVDSGTPVPKDKLSALVRELLATPEFSGKDMTLKTLRKEVERRLGQVLPREQKAQFTELVTEAMASIKEERPKGPLQAAEMVDIPRVQVPLRDLRLLTSTLTLDHCTDTLFQRLTKVVSHLAVVRENRESLVTEIAATVTVFSGGSFRNLVTLEEELQRAVAQGMSLVGVLAAAQTDTSDGSMEQGDDAKLLRVLQTISSLTSDEAAGAPEQSAALSLQTALASSTEQLGRLWGKLMSCLRVVSEHAGLVENKHDETSESDTDGGASRGGGGARRKGKGKERQGSGTPTPSMRSPRPGSRQAARTPRAGGSSAPMAPPAAPAAAAAEESTAAAAQSPILSALQARFLPLVEAFFVVNAAQDVVEVAATEAAPADAGALQSPGGPAKLMRVTSLQSCVDSPLPSAKGQDSGDALLGSGAELVAFVEANKALLNGIVRQHPSLIDAKGSLAALASMSRCRAHLDFDNKQVLLRSRLRKLSHAHHRRPGHLRLTVRRDHVLEDSFNQIAPKSVDELRGKLNVSFRGEEGVDAGGLTREWLLILFRAVFDPNLALFRQSADSPTMQPNPLSYVNSEHLNYFKFIGRVVGKAVHDGHLVDAFFTRSFYKHILNKPLHYTDLVSIDPVRKQLKLFTVVVAAMAALLLFLLRC